MPPRWLITRKNMKYDIFEIPDPKHPGEKIQHLRVVGAKRMSKDSFLKFMQERTACSTGTINDVLQGLSEVLAWSLADGYTIGIDDIGSFSLQIQKNGRTKVADLNKIHAKNVDVKGVTFQPSKHLIDEISRKAMFVRADEDIKSKIWEDEELEQAIRDFLAANGTMTRRQLQCHAKLSQRTAERRIKHFLETGLIKNVGTRYRPVYQLTTH